MASLLMSRLKRAETMLKPKGAVVVVVDRGDGDLESELEEMRADGRLRAADELVIVRMRFTDLETPPGK
jgi:hypothetical protein